MKKLLALILSAVMLTSFNVYAQNEEYEQVVLKVKNVLDIGNYDNFECTEYSDKGKLFLNMSWSNKDNNSSVDVNCDNEGNIYNYYIYDNNENKTQIYNENECKQTADAFLNKILGEKYSSIKYMDYYLNYNSYSYTYNIVNNGIPFSSDKININVNKYTNTVMNSSIPYFLFNIQTDNFSSAIGTEKANEILKNKFDMVYITIYDYENEKYNIIPAYAPKYYHMDAITGEKFDNDFFHYDYGTTEAAASGNAKAMSSKDEEYINLTEAEKNEINDLKSIIKPEYAVNKLNSLFGLNINASDINYNYYKNKIENKNYYNLNINYNKDMDIYASFDQEGRLISFNKYMDYENNENADRKILREKAEAIIKSNYHSLDFALRDENNERPVFNFDVFRNGILSVDEGIRIEFNGDSQVMYADFNIKSYINYPPVNAAVTKDEAFNKAMSEFPLEMSYFVVFNNSSGIYNVYDIYNINASYAVDAMTGDIISIENGRPISKNNNKINAYKDISDQWYADMATKLLYMDFRFEGDNFEGDKPLTFADFEKFYFKDNNIKYAMENKNNYDKYSKDPNRPLTRYEFAEIFSDILGYGKITGLDIYKPPYNDIENNGSVAILKGLGLLDNADEYNGNNIITRAEAANIVYKNIINN